MEKYKVVIKNIYKMGIVTSSIIMLALFVFTIKVPAANSQVIENNERGIPDKVLYQEILFHLDKKSGDKITKKDAEKIFVLSTTDYDGKKNIKTLKGIEYCKNLLNLEIHENSLSNLSGIEKLPKLEVLRIGKGKIRNIDKLKNMTNLVELSIVDNKIEDWTAIGNLKKLSVLKISGCGLKGFSKKLNNLDNLTSLTLENNNITNLEVIVGLNNLEILNVNNNRLKTLKGVENLLQLKELYASDNKIININSVKKMSQLEILDVSKNKIKKLPNLKDLKKLNLEYSSFMYNAIGDKNFETNLPHNIVKEKWWINNQILLQNTKKKLKIYRLSYITNKTKKN